MPCEINFAAGQPVRLTMPIEEVLEHVAGGTSIDSHRFAGFYPDGSPAPAERVVVNVATIAYVVDIPFV